jgi:hypothetical protein
LCRLLGSLRLLFQPYGLLSGGHALALGSLFCRFGLGLIAFALISGLLLGALRIDVGVHLGATTLLLDLLLALLRRDFGLQALALDVSLCALLSQFGLALALLSLSGLARGLEPSVRLSLLQTPLPRQVLIVAEGSRCLLRFA